MGVSDADQHIDSAKLSPYLPASITLLADRDPLAAFLAWTETRSPVANCFDVALIRREDAVRRLATVLASSASNESGAQYPPSGQLSRATRKSMIRRSLISALFLTLPLSSQVCAQQKVDLTREPRLIAIDSIPTALTRGYGFPQGPTLLADTLHARLAQGEFGQP